MNMLLGCIAGDFTGATDLANTLTRRGMHTVPAITAAFADLRCGGVRHAIVDALEDEDLVQLGAACAGHALV